jgi:hypothetical protein
VVMVIPPTMLLNYPGAGDYSITSSAMATRPGGDALQKLAAELIQAEVAVIAVGHPSGARGEGGHYDCNGPICHFAQ